MTPMPAQHADPDRAQTLTLQAEDLIEGVLARVPEGGWDAPSAVAPWTIRDVAGHVTWGRRLMTHTVTGRPFDDRSGAPGQPHQVWQQAPRPAALLLALAPFG